MGSSGGEGGVWCQGFGAEVIVLVVLAFADYIAPYPMCLAQALRSSLLLPHVLMPVYCHCYCLHASLLLHQVLMPVATATGTACPQLCPSLRFSCLSAYCLHASLLFPLVIIPVATATATACPQLCSSLVHVFCLLLLPLLLPARSCAPPSGFPA